MEGGRCRGNISDRGRIRENIEEWGIEGVEMITWSRS